MSSFRRGCDAAELIEEVEGEPELAGERAADVKTPMIYTHVLGLDAAAVRSPVDQFDFD